MKASSYVKQAEALQRKSASMGFLSTRVNLTDTLKMKLWIVAAVEGVSQSAVVRAALREFFEGYKVEVPADVADLMEVK
ncbi:MAG: hypothetical protein IJU31_06860 [Synergistaceae bacterium]|nr:hypothetical protein [Synergistaceae bacterium]